MKDKLRALLAREINCFLPDPIEFEENTAFADLLLDSLDMVEINMLAEDIAEHEIEEDVFASLTTFGKLADYMAALPGIEAAMNSYK